MIGNDVVDLADPETAARACHARFEARVLAPRELAALGSARDRTRLRWILWAAKEAAYKAARALDPSVAFSPRRFEVTLSGDADATVRHARSAFAVALTVRRSHVHAVARPLDETSLSQVDGGARGPGEAHGVARDAAAELVVARNAESEPIVLRDVDADPIVAAVARLAPHRRIGSIRVPRDAAEPGRAARALAVTTVAARLGLEASDLRVARSPGRPPVLLYRDRRLAGSLSLSHHGRFVAFAYAPARAALRTAA